jgi:hypothetical protein
MIGHRDGEARSVGGGARDRPVRRRLARHDRRRLAGAQRIAERRHPQDRRRKSRRDDPVAQRHKDQHRTRQRRDQQQRHGVALFRLTRQGQNVLFVAASRGRRHAGTLSLL